LLFCNNPLVKFAVYGSRGEAGSFARLWDAVTGNEVWQQAVETGSITTATFSPDGKVLATAGALLGFPVAGAPFAFMA
jgi:WD40 repeat protein